MPTVFSKFCYNEDTESLKIELEDFRIETFKKILLTQANTINIRDRDGDTAIMKLCKYRPWELKSIRFLLENGGCPNIPDFLGNTPYSISKLRGHVDCCKLLIDFKSNKSSSSMKKRIRKKKKNRLKDCDL